MNNSSDKQQLFIIIFILIAIICIYQYYTVSHFTTIHPTMKYLPVTHLVTTKRPNVIHSVTTKRPNVIHSVTHLPNILSTNKSKITFK